MSHTGHLKSKNYRDHPEVKFTQWLVYNRVLVVQRYNAYDFLSVFSTLVLLVHSSSKTPLSTLIVVQEKENKMSLQNVSIVLSPIMQISCSECYM